MGKAENESFFLTELFDVLLYLKQVAQGARSPEIDVSEGEDSFVFELGVGFALFGFSVLEDGVDLRVIGVNESVVVVVDVSLIVEEVSDEADIVFVAFDVLVFGFFEHGDGFVDDLDVFGEVAADSVSEVGFVVV